jgi:hypothetical protein
MTVDPGLLLINKTNGWFSAAQACLGSSADIDASCDAVLRTRLDCWEIENRIIAAKHRPHDDDDPGTRDTLSGELVAAKYRLRDLLATVDPAYLPPDSDQWWQNYEAHTEALTPAPFWLVP